MTEAQQVFHNVIDGELVDAASGETYDVVDPTTGQAYATAPMSGPEDIDRAYRAAERAFATWGRTTPAERQRAMLKIADESCTASGILSEDSVAFADCGKAGQIPLRLWPK